MLLMWLCAVMRGPDERERRCDGLPVTVSCSLCLCVTLLLLFPLQAFNAEFESEKAERIKQRQAELARKRAEEEALKLKR